MPFNIPIALTWLRIAMIPLLVGLFYLPDAWTASGWRDCAAAIAFIVDPENVIQHVSVNNLNVGRNPEEILRVLDGLQTDELCPCNRAVGGETLKAA